MLTPPIHTHARPARSIQCPRRHCCGGKVGGAGAGGGAQGFGPDPDPTHKSYPTHGVREPVPGAATAAAAPVARRASGSTRCANLGERARHRRTHDALAGRCFSGTMVIGLPASTAGRPKRHTSVTVEFARSDLRLAFAYIFRYAGSGRLSDWEAASATLGSVELVRVSTGHESASASHWLRRSLRDSVTRAKLSGGESPADARYAMKKN